MPLHILKKERTDELWLRLHIFSTTENSKNHSNVNYRKMSEDSDTKESIRPSSIKSGSGCPAKVGITGTLHWKVRITSLSLEPGMASWSSTFNHVEAASVGSIMLVALEQRGFSFLGMSTLFSLAYVMSQYQTTALDRSFWKKLQQPEEDRSYSLFAIRLVFISVIIISKR